MTADKPFDTNIFFSGGAGMFLQYHDVIKPVYLYTIIKMLMTNESFGLPLNIIQNMSMISIIEWYMKRRFKNPLQCLDYNHKLDSNDLDDLLQKLLLSDDSIYRLSPILNIGKMLHVYRQQHMTFPIYVYSEHEEPYIKEDCKNIFQGIECHYFFGDLKTAIKKCDQNFTYIFSDIELVKDVSEILLGTCSHVLLTREYRYNYIDNCKTLKYNLFDIAKSHPFVRMGTTLATDSNQLLSSLINLTIQEEV